MAGNPESLLTSLNSEAAELHLYPSRCGVVEEGSMFGEGQGPSLTFMSFCIARREACSFASRHH